MQIEGSGAHDRHLYERPCRCVHPDPADGARSDLGCFHSANQAGGYRNEYLT